MRRWLAVPHLCVGNLGELGSETDCTTQGSSVGKLSLKTSGCKYVGVVAVGETPSLTGEFIGEPQVPRMYTKCTTMQQRELPPPSEYLRLCP